MVRMSKLQGRKTKWRTREGQEIPIKDMTNQHLTNCIAFLKRRKGSVTLEDFGGWEELDSWGIEKLEAPFPIETFLGLEAYRENIDLWIKLMQKELMERRLNDLGI